MRRRTAILVAILLALAPLAAQSGTEVDQAVEEFHQICLVKGPDFLRMSQEAYDRDWEMLPEVAFDDLAPIAEPEMVRVWLTTDADKVFLREP